MDFESEALCVSLRGRDGEGTAELGGPISNCLRASTGGGDKPHVLCFTGDLTHALKAEGHDGSEDGRGRGTPIIVHGTQDPCVSEIGHALGRNMGQEKALLTHGAVRRLMPIECERLQGLPDGHTLVPHSGGPMRDGPRYKIIGNGWALNCVRWIAGRIVQEMRHV